jgi:S-layer homology domain
MKSISVKTILATLATGALFLLALAFTSASVFASAPTQQLISSSDQGVASGVAPAVAACSSNWQVVSSPNQSTTLDRLYDVSAVSSSDVWAVGHSNNGSVDQTLIEHWNGTQWSVVSSPSAGTSGSQLRAVAAIAANDVWAAGYYNDASVNKTLIEHWNGTQWQIVTSPNVGAGSNYLYGIDAVSATDVWATGSYVDAQNGATWLREHWNGTSWTTLTGYGTGQLYGVDAVSSTDVWMGASSGSGSSVLNWDGTTLNPLWYQTGGTYEAIRSVTEISPTDVWAVGDLGDYAFTYPLRVHYDGNTWTKYAYTDTVREYGQLWDVAALSTNDVWAVGGYYLNHWNGTTWEGIAGPTSPDTSVVLHGITRAASNDLWAVGEQTLSDTQLGTLVERYNPCPATATPTRTSTATRTATGTSTSTATRTSTTTRTSTGTATRTSTATASPTRTATAIPTNTATAASIASSTSTATATKSRTATQLPNSTATATATTVPTTECAITFTDVPSSNSFYQYVRCLACRGVLGGYSLPSRCTETGAPCFRPGDSITRGQMAKVVANAAGFTEDHSEVSFADVPTSHTFYVYIQRLASRGVVGGYSDPAKCPDGKAPCFLPDANVTRGQMSKFVALAAGFHETLPAGQQTFADVPSTNPFWQYIERLASRSIVSGYGCGAVGEPCPGVYFRSTAFVTRGQASKFVSLAFFPNCATLAANR